MIEVFAFGLFTIAMLFGAVCVIVSSNPVYSILFMVWTFFSAAGLFIIQGAEFLGYLLVIVYVGAIAVLFLFIVMLMNVTFRSLKEGLVKHYLFSIGIAAVVLLQIVMAILSKKETLMQRSSPIPTNNLEFIGEYLYSVYAVPFIVAGFILLIGMVGAISLTHRKRADLRRQNLADQAATDYKERVQHVDVSSRGGVK